MPLCFRPLNEKAKMEVQGFCAKDRKTFIFIINDCRCRQGRFFTNATKVRIIEEHTKNDFLKRVDKKEHNKT